ncbi:MAG: HYR domain-containing protein, partial [Gemmatimonadales bacterium]
MRHLCLVLVVALLGASQAIAQTISTVAGGGPNNLPATQANLFSPTGVAVDASGNFYLAAQGLHRVFKVDINGTLTVVAGNGTRGFSGDGGPATTAALNSPFGVAVDAAGNLFIADVINNRIRKVDTSGIITTVAGNGTVGFSGDGGPATTAALAFPSGVAVDAAGNLFIADQINQRIRKVDTSGIITTVAGNGTLGFSGDGGPATTAALANPLGVAVDAAGNLFIADSSNQRIRQVAGAGAGGDTTPPTLTLPGDITVEATAASGAVVSFSATATDDVDPSPTISCSPPSGSTFALVPTTVTCTATDTSGNTASASFTVTVVDTTPPVLGPLPANQTLEATSPAGALATYVAPTATDTVDLAPGVSCLPASGSTFPVLTGSTTTPVTCTATDASGNSSSGTFTITVQDTTPPVITAPLDITVGQGLASTSRVITAFLDGATASDLVDGLQIADNNFTAPFPFPLPLGSITVIFTKTDAANNP